MDIAKHELFWTRIADVDGHDLSGLYSQLAERFESFVTEPVSMLDDERPFWIPPVDNLSLGCFEVPLNEDVELSQTTKWDSDFREAASSAIESAVGPWTIRASWGREQKGRLFLSTSGRRIMYAHGHSPLEDPGTQAARSIVAIAKAWGLDSTTSPTGKVTVTGVPIAGTAKALSSAFGREFNVPRQIDLLNLPDSKCGLDMFERAINALGDINGMPIKLATGFRVAKQLAESMLGECRIDDVKWSAYFFGKYAPPLNLAELTEKPNGHYPVLGLYNEMEEAIEMQVAVSKSAAGVTVDAYSTTGLELIQTVLDGYDLVELEI